MGFEPQVIAEDPGTFHARTFDDVGRSLWVPTLTAPPTLVLGSSQSPDEVDQEALDHEGIALTKRRSGGGAVLVGPDELVWFDVIIPTTDPLWHADVGRSFDWLGLACQRALAGLGVTAELHTGRLVQTEWSRKVCFASLGPGELTVDGKKLVGMSQRRTRTAARIQVAILRRWDGARHAALLNLPEEERLRAAEDLTDVATGLDLPPSRILDAIFSELAN